MREGRVISVNTSAERGTGKSPVSRAEVDAHGLVGDAHAGEGHRQVSLLSAECIERFADAAGRLFGWGDFGENITTRGLDLSGVRPLDRFRADSGVELEVTQLGNRSHGEGCPICREFGRCVMSEEGLFCRVAQGGVLDQGMRVAHVPRVLRCRVITLSDRASRGVYADRSGPRIRERLESFCHGKHWNPEISTAILPDDAGRLREELTAARDARADVIMTTGSTGIGPRDVAPEAVMALDARVLPGIMECIRVKYGSANPRALLSRSVAAVLGESLVFTLPGSIRAVDEYLDEIEKVLEHALYMLRGLDLHH